MEFSSTYVESDVLLTKIQQTVNSLDTSSSTNLRVVLEGGLNDLRGGDEEGCLRWSGVAEEWAWEQLHTGHWKDTSIACRELYSLASLLRGLAFAKMGEHEKSLEVIDKGILMGAPVLGHTLQEMATILTTHISGSKEKEDCLTAMVTNAGADQPEVSGDGKELAVKDDKSDQSLQAQKDVTGKVMLKKRVRFRSFVEYDSDTTEPPCKRLKEASPSPDREGMEDPRIDSDHQIKVLTNPSISAFQDVMDSAKPVILCKCMEHWPAMGTRRWRYEFPGVGCFELVVCRHDKNCLRRQYFILFSSHYKLTPSNQSHSKIITICNCPKKMSIKIQASLKYELSKKHYMWEE